MVFVLGIHGPAQSGKDTVADFLITHHGWDGKLSFAGNLKEMCKAIFFLTDFDVNDQLGKACMFSRPKIFTGRNLGSVLHWMSRTCSNPRVPVPKGAYKKVKSLIGTKLESPRRVLQFVGTEICRELLPTYHADVLLKKISSIDTGKYIVTDVRFPDEGDFIHNTFSGFVVNLRRPLCDTMGGVDRSHRSETAMLEWGKFDDVINNDKDGLDFLYSKVDNFIERNNLCQTIQ